MDPSHLLPVVSSSSPSDAASSSSSFVIGAVDYCGKPASRHSSGRWTAALFIIGVEIAERFAYSGISSNLITYLTGPLRESTTEAAVAVNTWSGVSFMLPFAGAFVADSYLGRYRMIVFASLLYILGLVLLTVSSVMTSLHPPKCMVEDARACAPNNFQVGLFYFAMYLVALAQGCHKPCIQAFGADQFDEKNPEECISRSSFFNWWYAGLLLGSSVTTILLVYVQDNISWVLGFGLPLISTGLALILFLFGTKTYRFYQLEGENPYLRVGKSFVTLLKRSMTPHELTRSRTLSDAQGGLKHTKFEKDEAPDTVQLEEARGVLRLVPIWTTCLIYGVVTAQLSTFFTKQGSTLDRRIGSSFQVPPAAMQSFIGISIIVFAPVYDQILVPVFRKFTKISTGITQLQRIGAGLILSLISMGIAGLVEFKRLKTVKDYGLIDQPKTMIPMSLWWLIPQYVLYGIADVFTLVGLQDFFYDQVPDALRSLGLALYLSIYGIGNFISSLLIFVINKMTSRWGENWFPDNLNHAHLDYFYWLLAGLNAAGLILYMYFARAYVYKKKRSTAL